MASRSLNVVISADDRGFRGAVNRVERDTDRLDRRLSGFGDNVGGLSLRLGALGGSFGTLAPAIAALTPAVVALGGSFAAAAGGAGALGAGLGASLAPILVVGKQVTSRFGEIKKAYEALQTAQREGTAASKKNAEQAMAGLSKSEQGMARALGRLSGLQEKVLGGASDRIFTALTKAIPMVAPMLEGLAKPFNRLGDAIGASIGSLAKTLSGPAWSNAFKAFIDSASSLVRPMTSIFTSIGNIIRDVALAALPMVQDAIKGIADWFRELDRNATRSKVREIVGGLVDQTKAWFDLFRELGGLMFRVFSSGAGSGKGLVGTLTNVVRAVNHFIDGMRAGEGAGGKFAAGVSAAFNAARSAVGTAVRVIRKWLDDHRADIHSVVQALRRLGEFARTTWQETLLPIVRRTVNAIKPIVQGLGDVIRGLVRFVSGLLSGNWSKAWSGAKEAVSGAWKVISTVVSTGVSNLREIIKDLGPKLVRLIVRGIGNLGKALGTGIFEGIKAAAKAVPGLAAGALKGIGHAITSGISAGFGALNPFGDGIGMTGAAFPSGGAFGGSLMGAQTALKPFAAVGSQFGLHVSSGRRPGSITSSGNVSYHSSGEAIDMADGRGPDSNKMGFFQYMKSHFGGRLAELIYTPGGAGIKDGHAFQYTGKVAADHYDHVHVALDTGRPGVGDGRGKGDGIGFRGLEDLWVRAGGSAKLAPLMAHVAQAESGGNPAARNPSGASGLWQILGQPFRGNVFDPLTNARMAVWKYQHQGLGAWAASRGSWGRYAGSGETYSSGSGGSGASSSSSTAVSRGMTPAQRQHQAAVRQTTVGGQHAAAVTGARQEFASLTVPGGGGYGQHVADAQLGEATARSRDNLKGLIKALNTELGLKRKRLAKIRKTLKRRLKAATRRALTDEATTLIGEIGDLKDTLKEYRADQKAGATTVTRAEQLDAGVDTNAASAAGGGTSGDGGGSGGDPNQALIDAINAAAEIQARLDEDLRGVRASMDAQTAVAQGIQAADDYQLKKYVADLLGGFIVGRGVTGRSFTPGTGVAFAYSPSVL